MTTRPRILVLLPVLALAALPFAPARGGPPPAGEEDRPAGTTYWFGTSEARTTVLFESDTTLEVMHGICRKMSGSATFDFDKGEGAVDLAVPVEAMSTGMDKRDEHMKGEGYLDAAKFPEINFKSKSLKRTKTDPESKKETWAWEGPFTLHGVSKDLKGDVTVQRIPEETGKVLGRGTWIKVKTAFQVTLKDHGIQVPEVAAAKISPTWDIKVDIFGTTEKPKAKDGGAGKPKE